MKNLIKFYSILLTAFIGNQAFADELPIREHYNCSLLIARTQGMSPVVAIESKDVFIGYSDESDPNDLQVVFTFPSEGLESLSSLGRLAVLAKLERTGDPEDPNLEIGFYRSHIQMGEYNPRELPSFKGGIQSSGVLQVPDMQWRYEPVYVVSSQNFNFNGDASIMLDAPQDRRNSYDRDIFGHEITGNTQYRNVELYCSRQ